MIRHLARSLRPMSRLGDASGNSVGDAPADPAWSCEEIERLYRQALDAVEAVADDLSSVTQSLSNDAESETDGEDEKSTSREENGVAIVGLSTADVHVADRPAASAPADEDDRLNPVQVIEALLFVGGQPLTAKTICGVLRGEFDADFVEQAIEEINRRYASQNRPYEIRLGEGGHRIVLRPEYEPLRNRVYGFGPKQVRLSQETLEILALVAYRQPITRRKAEEIAKRNAGSSLRQLLERGLLILDHPEGTPAADAHYRTSARFLQLFGVGRLEDLPQIEDINFK
jgi:segregation and condensation protein B